ncbi:acetylcholinesterase-like isoform X1 [Lethenteron reissneri]|uniref:acetylcholinesterase-like isoform X1 n=1 Tax=Lethenteron reissneri TaxID=7753 RepID=UPI002AB6E52B|nr:acetylcholinesterase-like isoform X1 [Lethenteron reissneri]
MSKRTGEMVLGHSMTMMLMNTLLGLVPFLVLSTCSIHSNTVIRTVARGKLQGLRINLGQGISVEAFVGVPYAKPPIGDLRFKKPVPLEKWDGVYNATTFSPACYQKPWFLEEISFGKFDHFDEDCLYLNVFIPEVDTADKMAVMVWIHGGAYRYGTAEEYEGRFLAAAGVILVTVNYRLGPLGWLSTGDEQSRGNYGLWDQHAALMWVKHNIESFGGDANRVTIFGESSGGGGTGLHLFSQHSQGLFQAAVSQSGCALAHWAILLPPWKASDTAAQLANALQCPTSPTKDMITCLKTKPAEVFHDVDVKGPPMISPWAPVIDEDFIERNPRELLQRGEHSKVPLMIGVVKDELAEEWPDSPTMTRLEFEEQMKNWVNRFQENKEATYEALLYEYTDHVNPEDEEIIREKFIEMKSDYEYIAPALYHAEGHARGGSATFVYTFNYRTHSSPWAPWYGVPHGEELYYEFGTPLWNDSMPCPWTCGAITHWHNRQSSWLESDKQMSHFFIQLVTNFAKYHDPTPAMLNMSTAWPTFDLRQRKYLHIDTTSEARSDLRAREMYFWNNYFPKVINRTFARVVQELSK